MKRFFLLAAIALLTISTAAQWLDVPAYHPRPPKKAEKMSGILSGAKLRSATFKYPFQAHSYRLAAKISPVVYQLPCYCHCDRSIGHTSLRSCFESEHGAVCAVCMKEVLYAYKLTKQGKKPADIREGIIRGDFNQIDLKTATEIQ